MGCKSCGGIVRAVQGAVDGLISGDGVIADPEVVELRRKICSQCRFYRVRRHGLDKCNVCSCYVKAKTLLKSEKCPKEFW